MTIERKVSRICCKPKLVLCGWMRHDFPMLRVFFDAGRRLASAVVSGDVSADNVDVTYGPYLQWFIRGHVVNERFYDDGVTLPFYTLLNMNSYYS